MRLVERPRPTRRFGRLSTPLRATTPASDPIALPPSMPPYLPDAANHVDAVRTASASKPHRGFTSSP